MPDERCGVADPAVEVDQDAVGRRRDEAPGDPPKQPPGAPHEPPRHEDHTPRDGSPQEHVDGRPCTEEQAAATQRARPERGGDEPEKRSRPRRPDEPDDRERPPRPATEPGTHPGPGRRSHAPLSGDGGRHVGIVDPVPAPRPVPLVPNLRVRPARNVARCLVRGKPIAVPASDPPVPRGSPITTRDACTQSRAARRSPRADRLDISGGDRRTRTTPAVASARRSTPSSPR